jgi:PKD repeat protein
MSIPSTDRIEYPASTLGIESHPQGVLAKGTLWILQLGYSRLFIKEYGGSRYELGTLIVKDYVLTAALKSELSIDSNRLWVWVVDLQDNLSLYEFEPYTASTPVLTYSKLDITTNINCVSVFVGSLSPVRIAALYNTNEFKSIGYENIRLSDPPVIGDLKWESSRLDQFDIYSYSDRTALEITYLDVASPPNVYIESYTIAVPTNLSVSQVDDTNEISLSWNAVVDADSYIIDRDTNSSFPSPVSISTTLLAISDFVPATGTYYYRVKAVNESLLLWSPWSGNEQVTLTILADFYGAPLTAYTGSIIQFTDISTPTGAITSWDWDFGDASSHSTDQNPTHIYLTPGIYTVTLIAYSLSESDTVVKTDYITISASVIADFYGVPTSIAGGDSVQFTDTSFGTPTSWDWDFGDATSHSFIQNPTHSYSDTGTYTVSLTVSDSYSISTETKPDYITVSPPLIAAFTGTPLSGPANLLVQFTDTSFGDPISWDWDFGDGSTHSTSQNPIHVYTQAGVHAVVLTVTDGTIWSTATHNVSVDMVADFSSNIQVGPVELTVAFSDYTLGEPTDWDWDFGDGSPHSTVQNPTHTYTIANNYTVTLIAYNTEASDTVTKVDYITATSTANFYAEPRTGYSTLSVQFIDLSKGPPTAWYWDFGDSNFSTEQNPTHFYNSPGEYTVTLVASSSFNSASETKVGYIIVSGTATPDIAPEPDKLMYLSEKVDASRNNFGIKIKYKDT